MSDKIIGILSNALAAAADELRLIARYRMDALQHDRDILRDERTFTDLDDWRKVESLANQAHQSALQALKSTKVSQ